MLLNEIMRNRSMLTYGKDWSVDWSEEQEQKYQELLAKKQEQGRLSSVSGEYGTFEALSNERALYHAIQNVLTGNVSQDDIQVLIQNQISDWKR